MHGDVYITCHSNLHSRTTGGMSGGGGGINVVFHLVLATNTAADEDSAGDEGSGGDVAERTGRIENGSALHCALSVIMRTCFDHNITTLSLPLLLTPSLRPVSEAGGCGCGSSSCWTCSFSVNWDF